MLSVFPCRTQRLSTLPNTDSELAEADEMPSTGAGSILIRSSGARNKSKSMPAKPR